MSMKQGMFEEDGFESTFNVLVDTKRIRSKCPLHYRPSPIPDDSYLLNAKVGRNVEAIRAVVFSEVASVSAIDLHTHLLPPSHGALCLWGIDELLTYVCHDLCFCNLVGSQNLSSLFYSFLILLNLTLLNPSSSFYSTI
jgi:hypothetical protein